MNLNRRQMIKAIGATICAGAVPTFAMGLIPDTGLVPIPFPHKIYATDDYYNPILDQIRKEMIEHQMRIVEKAIINGDGELWAPVQTPDALRLEWKGLRCLVEGK